LVLTNHQHDRIEQLKNKAVNLCGRNNDRPQDCLQIAEQFETKTSDGPESPKNELKRHTTRKGLNWKTLLQEMAPKSLIGQQERARMKASHDTCIRALDGVTVAKVGVFSAQHIEELLFFMFALKI
jgi:hypothetical protein